jgi:low affinity Fe/Cu permease
MNSPGNSAKSNLRPPGPAAESDPPEERSRSAVSRWLSRIDRYASRPAVALLVLGAVVTWLVVSVAAGFPARWETVFQTLVAALTLAMVFVIQHTQGRHQRATQRKLDEILRALPGADNSLMTLEHASDEELHATGHEHRRIRQAALGDQDAAGE